MALALLGPRETELGFQAMGDLTASVKESQSPLSHLFPTVLWGELSEGPSDRDSLSLGGINGSLPGPF